MNASAIAGTPHPLADAARELHLRTSATTDYSPALLAGGPGYGMRAVEIIKPRHDRPPFGGLIVWVPENPPTEAELAERNRAQDACDNAVREAERLSVQAAGEAAAASTAEAVRRIKAERAARDEHRAQIALGAV